MKRNNYAAILLVGLLMGTMSACRQSNEIPDGSFVAFSLREAQRMLLHNDDGSADSSLITLGGITRLVGMVIDRENDDIILIGMKNRQLPKANFDDLVVALRARMVHDELPMVSIDPVEKTKETGKQEVRFGGRIENTSFGRDFLDCDILLKQYSLELLKQLEGIKSYQEFLLDKGLDELRQEGVIPTGIRWLDAQQIREYHGKGVVAEGLNQARFWFNYKDPYRVRIRGDVFCIMSLDIIVEREVQSSEFRKVRSESDTTRYSSPDLLFAENFSKHFLWLSQTYPILRRVKLLFDMTAIAEGLKQTNSIPDLNYLLYEYSVKATSTLKEFGLIEKCAVIERNDGKSSLIQISGGISSSVEVELLNAGDVSYLKKFTIESRPKRKSLFWKIPVDEWRMPNSVGLITKATDHQNAPNIGCIVNTRFVELSSADMSQNSFKGFNSVPAADPVNTKGVQMRMEVDTANFIWADSLRVLKDRIMNKRTRSVQ